MLQAVLTLSEGILAARTPREASAAFHAATAARGATYLQSRYYRRPTARLTAARHWAAGGFVARYARSGWVDSTAFRYICFEENPLLEPIRKGLTRYRFSDLAPRAERRFETYWEALGEAGIGDALCSTSYGSDRRITSVHVGFAAGGLDARDAEAVQASASIFTEKLMSFETSGGEAGTEPALSDRERDSIAFVAEGKTDWEIAQILGVAESTARFHVDNARRKLGAVNRAHAVARFLTISGPF